MNENFKFFGFKWKTLWKIWRKWEEIEEKVEKEEKSEENGINQKNAKVKRNNEKMKETERIRVE